MNIFVNIKDINYTLESKTLLEKLINILITQNHRVFFSLYSLESCKPDTLNDLKIEHSDRLELSAYVNCSLDENDINVQIERQMQTRENLDSLSVFKYNVSEDFCLVMIFETSMSFKNVDMHIIINICRTNECMSITNLNTLLSDMTSSYKNKEGVFDTNLVNFRQIFENSILKFFGVERFLNEFKWGETLHLRSEFFGGLLFSPHNSKLIELDEKSYNFVANSLNHEKAGSSYFSFEKIDEFSLLDLVPKLQSLAAIERI